MTDRASAPEGRLREIIIDFEEAVAVKNQRQRGICSACGVDHDNEARLNRAVIVLTLKRLRLVEAALAPRAEPIPHRDGCTCDVCKPSSTHPVGCACGTCSCDYERQRQF